MSFFYYKYLLIYLFLESQVLWSNSSVRPPAGETLSFSAAILQRSWSRVSAGLWFHVLNTVSHASGNIIFSYLVVKSSFSYVIVFFFFHLRIY